MTGLIFILLSAFIHCNQDKIADQDNLMNLAGKDSVVFAVIGDYGIQGKHEQSVSDLVKSWNPDFIITAGDNNYFGGDYSTLKRNISKYYGDYIYNYDAPLPYRCKGKAFLDSINRFFPSLGNHDDNLFKHYNPYLSYFTLPGNEMYYTFDRGPVSFFAINSLPSDVNDQKEWLRQQLLDNKKKFRIVYFHHSPYSPGPHGNCERMQWDFKAMGINAVLTGHDHLYTRIEKKGEEEVHYLINGAGGCSLYPSTFFPLDTNKFIVKSYSENYGAIRGIATQDKLILEFFSIGNENSPVDRIEIK